MKSREFVPVILVQPDRRAKDGAYTNREEVSFPLNYKGYVDKVTCVTPEGWKLTAPLTHTTYFYKGDTISFAAGNIKVTGDILNIFRSGVDFARSVYEAPTGVWDEESYDSGYWEGYNQGYDAALSSHVCETTHYNQHGQGENP